MSINIITYTVTYKRPYLFGKKVTLKDCIGDGVEPDCKFRFFDLLCGEKVFVPIDYEVAFSKERNVSIEKAIKDQVR